MVHNQFLISAYNCDGRFFIRIRVLFRLVAWGCIVVYMKKRTFSRQFATFSRLVFDTFGRMTVIAFGFEHYFLSDTRNTKADLVYQTDWCVSGLFLLQLLFRLYCLCFVIAVPAKENLVDHVCLYLRLSCSCHV